MISRLSAKNALILSFGIFAIIILLQFIVKDYIITKGLDLVDALSGFLFGYGIAVFFQFFRRIKQDAMGKRI